MSMIPAIKLPSSGKSIKFREATVDDCLSYCDLNESFDEMMTTEYLNSIQEGELSDSALWTAQDRRTAIWWIFICTSKDTTIGYEYQCQHCGGSHVQLVDLVDLDDEATSLTIKPYIDDEMAFKGKYRDIRFHPYNGLAMAHMEMARIERDNYAQGTAEHIKATAKLKILEVAHSFDFQDSKPKWYDFIGTKKEREKSFEESLQEKLDVIASMSRVNEFPLLVAAAKAAQEKLAHGLNISFVDGQAHVVSPALPCETKVDGKGEAMQTRLLIPFRGSVFIPTL